MSDAGTRAPGLARAHAGLYASAAKQSAIWSLQYRANVVMETVLMAAEPVVNLAVWQLVARQQGGEVGGFTPERFAAYYITFGLVRTLTQIGAPQNWGHWIRTGEMSTMLMRPMHPVHFYLARWLGFGGGRALAWLPVGAVLTAVFQPDFDTGPLQVVVFVAAVPLALTIRTLLTDTVGMTAFWLININGIASLLSIIDAVTSGRIVPPELMPGWAQAVSWALPFRWTFAFPIEVLIGPIDGGDLLVGLAMQVLWLGVVIVLLRFVWARGVSRYGAVGG